jgi:hypothetical protein
MKKRLYSFFMLKFAEKNIYSIRWNNSNVFNVQNCQFVLFDTVIN